MSPLFFFFDFFVLALSFLLWLILNFFFFFKKGILLFLHFSSLVQPTPSTPDNIPPVVPGGCSVLSVPFSPFPAQTHMPLVAFPIPIPIPIPIHVLSRNPVLWRWIMDENITPLVSNFSTLLSWTVATNVFFCSYGNLGDQKLEGLNCTITVHVYIFTVVKGILLPCFNEKLLYFHNLFGQVFM